MRKKVCDHCRVDLNYYIYATGQIKELGKLSFCSHRCLKAHTYNFGYNAARKYVHNFFGPDSNVTKQIEAMHKELKEVKKELKKYKEQKSNYRL